jgi:hypothetical protein
METVRINTKSTDVYLDRYIQVKMVNLIKQVTEPALSDYDDKKMFNRSLEKQF